MTLLDFIKMVKGYEEILDQVRAIGNSVMERQFPVYDDPRQRQQEFLTMVDTLALDTQNQEDAMYYRQLSLCVEGLLWLRLEKRKQIAD